MFCMKIKNKAWVFLKHQTLLVSKVIRKPHFIKNSSQQIKVVVTVKSCFIFFINSFKNSSVEKIQTSFTAVSLGLLTV